jgi:uncharacterized protein involved in type VI secretion and phage assembly
MIDTNAGQSVVPGTENSDLVTTLIKVNGQTVPDIVIPYSIRISRCANRIPFAVLTFIDGDVGDQQFEISDTDLLSPGHEIEIHLGYHGDNNLAFKGIIIRHSVKIMQESASFIEIECKDEAVKLTAGRKNKYFYNSTDSDILSEIIRSHDLSPEVEDTEGTHAEMVQFHATDWDFLVSRAEANSMLVLPEDGTLRIKQPDFEQEPKFALSYGNNIYEFEGQMDARDQYPSIKTHVWNPDNQEVEENEPGGGGASALGGGSSLSLPSTAVSSIAQSAGGALGLELPGTPPNTDYSQVMGLEFLPLQHTGHLMSEEAQQWAKAQETKERLAKKQGRVKFRGITDIYPGDMVELEGVGQRHSGPVFVTAVTHEIAEGGWFAHVQFGLPQRWFVQEYDDVEDQQAAALLPAVNGLQIGVVTGLENDPENAHRVQVRLPLLDRQGEGSWMRIACQDAGESRGAFWRPEIGDEVIVGFLNDDPRQAVILGSLNSTAKPAPLTATDDNHQKGWVTRSEMKWLFDDEKKSMTLETPGGKKVIVDEDADQIQMEDEHGNKIKMDSGGIVIDSAADLKLKAAQSITIEGMDISQKASSSLKLEGQAKAEMKASGDVVIRGSFVKIN